MIGMTPDEAANFYEEDEDPREVFAWFDAAPHGLTRRPTVVTAQEAAVQEPVAAEVVLRVVASGLYENWHRELLPEVSATGSGIRYASQA